MNKNVKNILLVGDTKDSRLVTTEHYYKLLKLLCCLFSLMRLNFESAIFAALIHI